MNVSYTVLIFVHMKRSMQAGIFTESDHQSVEKRLHDINSRYQELLKQSSLRKSRLIEAR